MTLEKLQDEYLKCATDPSYFLNNYGYVFDAKKQKVSKMTCFEYQDDCLQKYHKNRNNVILKSRQTGLSVITAGYVAWRLIFRKDEKILIIANDGSGAVRFLSTVKQFLDYTPSWLLPKEGLRLVNNQKEIKLANNSQAIAKASSPEAGRGDSLTLLVLDETAFIENANTIWMAAGMALSATQGKCIMLSCVPEDTYVFTNNGLTQIKNFINKEEIGGYNVDKYKILGKDGLRQGQLFFNNGFHKTKKITTTNSFLEGTLNHKVWACKSGNFNWFKLGELEAGDYISIQYGNELWGNNDEIIDFDCQDSGKCLNKFNPKKITKEIAYFLGLFLAEGSTYKSYNDKNEFVGGSVSLTCGDDISKAITDIGMKYYLAKDGLHYNIGCKQLILFLEYLGFDLKKYAKDKIIPQRLLEMSRENIIYLLRGIFDGDGYSRKDKGYVGISLNSKEMINQIRMLLLNFGILTDYYEVWTKPTKKVIKSTLNFRISCNGKNSKIFYEKINFNFKRKQLNEYVLDKCNFNRSDVNDIIPFSNDLLKKIYTESGHNTTWFKERGCYLNKLINSKNKKNNNVSRGVFLRVFELIKEKLSFDTTKEINKVLKENLKWNKINIVEYFEKDTYDFSLPNDKTDFWCHSVLYNGILGHQTPNGTGNLYNSIWVEADKKQSDFDKDDFVPTRVHWTQNPFSAEKLELRVNEEGEKEYWSPWYEGECKRMQYDKVKIAQELDLSFEGSKYLAIENELINKYDKRLLLEEYRLIEKNKTYYDYKNKPGERFVKYETPFTVYKPYIEGHKYILGSDVARGDGSDYSTIQVVDINSLEVVAEFKHKLAPDLFAHVIYNVAMDYGTAYVVVECNNHGLATAIDLSRKMNYPKMFYSKAISEIYARPYDYKIVENEVIPGFQTTKKSRPLLINNLRTHLRDGGLKIYSKHLMSEFKTFIQNGDKAEAEKGKHDDLIMALGIALFIRDTEYQNAADTKEMYMGMIDAIGFVSKSINGKDYSTNPTAENISEIPPDAGGIFFNDFSKENDENDDFNNIGWLLG